MKNKKKKLHLFRFFNNSHNKLLGVSKQVLHKRQGQLSTLYAFIFSLNSVNVR